MKTAAKVAFVALLGAPAVCQAQPQPPADAQAQAPSTKPQPQPLTTAEPTSPGRLSPFGRSLSDLGIRVRLQLVNEFAANPSGGVRQGSANVGQLQAGLSLDLEKIAGLKDGQFVFTFVRDYGSSLARDDIGTFTKAQENYKNEYHIFRLGLIAYNQKLFDRKLDVLVGRLGTTSLYGRLANTCFFESGLTCGVPQVLNSSAGFTKATSATWGGNLRYDFTPATYLEVGAFEVNSFIQHTHGFDWSTAHATGVTVPVEFGHGVFDLSKQRYPSSVKVGGYVSTAPFNDPFFNTEGNSVGLAGGTARSASHLRSGGYVMGEKTVWRPSARSPRSLSVFGGAVLPFESEEVMRAQAYGGAALRAPIASRPHDILSVEANYYRLSDRERNYLRDARQRAGGHGANNPNQVYFDASYSALIARGVRLAPDVQYIVNPDNSAIPRTTVRPHDAVVLGFKLTVNVANLLGLPAAPNLSD